MSANLHDVCDYVILRCGAARTSLNFLKLQKLLFYCQAWNLAFGRGRLFEGKFQAWVHGPVNREIYDRFSPTKSLYSAVLESDVRRANPHEYIPDDDRQTIDSVIDSYAAFSGVDLEAMSHRELPWVEARGEISELARCETEINEETMREFYSKRLPA